MHARRLPTSRVWFASTLAAALVFLAQGGWIYAKAAVAQKLIAMAWHRARNGDPSARPWPWADTRAAARITLGQPQQHLVVLEGDSGRNLAFGPAHDPASVLPGEVGNSVLAGHRDTHFHVLGQLHEGDRIRTELPDGRVTLFAVTDIRVVDSRRYRIQLDSEGPRLTLVTCYPVDGVVIGGPLRLVVSADAIGGELRH